MIDRNKSLNQLTTKTLRVHYIINHFYSDPASVQATPVSNPPQDESSSVQYQYNQSHTFRTTPIHMHSSSNATDLSNPSQQELAQYNQPLYANAPPKPRRLNDGSYSSPSPEVSDRYMGEIRYLTPTQQQQYIMQSMKKSPIHMYDMQGPHGEFICIQSVSQLISIFFCIKV